MIRNVINSNRSLKRKQSIGKKQLKKRTAYFGQADINTQRKLMQKQTENPTILRQQLGQKLKNKQCVGVYQADKKNTITFQRLKQIIKPKRGLKKNKNKENINKEIIKFKQFSVRIKQIIKLEQPKDYVWINLIILLWIPFNLFDIYFGMINKQDCLNYKTNQMIFSLRQWLTSSGFMGILNFIILCISYSIRLFVPQAQIYQRYIILSNFIIIVLKILVFDWIGYRDYFNLQDSQNCQRVIPGYIHTRLIFQCILTLLLVSWSVIYITQKQCFRTKKQVHNQKQDKNQKQNEINT